MTSSSFISFPVDLVRDDNNKLKFVPEAINVVPNTHIDWTFSSLQPGGDPVAVVQAVSAAQPCAPLEGGLNTGPVALPKDSEEGSLLGFSFAIPTDTKDGADLHFFVDGQCEAGVRMSVTLGGTPTPGGVPVTVVDAGESVGEDTGFAQDAVRRAESPRPEVSVVRGDGAKLSFMPDTITVAPESIIDWTFNALKVGDAPLTLVQAKSAAEPCEPLQGGLDSGPVEKSADTSDIDTVGYSWAIPKDSGDDLHFFIKGQCDKGARMSVLVDKKLPPATPGETQNAVPEENASMMQLPVDLVRWADNAYKFFPNMVANAAGKTIDWSFKGLEVGGQPVSLVQAKSAEEPCMPLEGGLKSEPFMLSSPDMAGGYSWAFPANTNEVNVFVDGHCDAGARMTLFAGDAPAGWAPPMYQNTGTKTIASGAVAGVAVGSVAFVGVVAAFGARKWLQARRARRTEGTMDRFAAHQYGVRAAPEKIV